MRIPRKTLVASLTATVALGAAASAFADGAADQVSQVEGSINSPVQSPDSAGKASLFTQVTTLDKDQLPVVPLVPPEIVRVDFPAELVYTANSKLDQCDPGAPGFLSTSTDAAVATCPDAVIGAGNAIARLGAFPQENSETEFAVTVFNGLTSVAGQQDSSDIAGTDAWGAGNPTIILHAFGIVGGTSVTLGEIRDSPTADTATAQFGKQLNVTDAPDVASDTGSLVLFNAQVQAKYTNGKTGDKKKVYSVIGATCDDTASDGDWDFRGEWTYDDASLDTDSNTNGSGVTTGAAQCTEK